MGVPENNQSAEGRIRELLREWRTEESTRVAAFERGIARLREQIAGAEALLALEVSKQADEGRTSLDTLPLFRSGSSAPDAASVSPRVVRGLRGLSQPEALVRIAQASGGVLRTVEAKRILIDAGLITGNPKNAASHLFSLLRDESRFERLGVRFEKIGPGQYGIVSLAAESRDGMSEADRSEADRSEADNILDTPASTYFTPGKDRIQVVEVDNT